MDPQYLPLRVAADRLIVDVAQRRDITLQEIPDPAGDASIAQIFFARNAATAQRIVQALRAGHGEE